MSVEATIDPCAAPGTARQFKTWSSSSSVACHSGANKKVSGTFFAKHPPGRSGKRFLTPFSLPSLFLGLIGLIASPVPIGVFSQQNGTAKTRDYSDGPLTAKDFQAPIPGFVRSVGRQALTTTDFRYEFEYRLYRSRRRTTARLSSIHIRAVVILSKSWNRQPGDARLMDHEQGHFDLTYIAVLRARLAFASRRMTGGAASDEHAIKNLRQQLDRHFRLLKEELVAAHVEYDEITNHGMKSGPQEEQRNQQRRQIEELTKRLKPARS